MNELQTYGIVLRYTNYREYDRILSLMTPGLGVISVSAIACRRYKSQLRTCCETFVFGQFTLKVVRDRYRLEDAVIINDFFALREDMDILSAAYYLEDFCHRCIQPNEANPEMFNLLAKSLNLLATNNENLQLILTFFKVKAIDAMGIAPSFDHCEECGSAIGKDTAFFSIPEAACLCSQCSGQQHDLIKIQPGFSAAYKYLQNMQPQWLKTYKLSNELMQDLNTFLDSYIKYHLGFEHKSY